MHTKELKGTASLKWGGGGGVSMFRERMASSGEHSMPDPVPDEVASGTYGFHEHDRFAFVSTA